MPLKLSQIPASTTGPQTTDQIVGVTAAVTDNLFTVAQLTTSIMALGNSTPDQLVSGGANVTSFGLGTIAGGTIVLDCGKCPLQFLTNNAAFILSAPTADGSMMLHILNGATAGTITFSGFTVGANTGDAIDTTNGHRFTLSIWRISGISGFRTAAHQ